MRPRTGSSFFKAKPSIQNYAELLEKHSLKYQDLGIYYGIGEIKKVQGWILHLSSIWTETNDLLETIVLLLKQYAIPFKVVKDHRTVDRITNGGFGYNKLGKVMCIYPPTDEIGLKLAKELLDVTKGFSGCDIPTDFHLGGIVYTRYGSFNPKLVWGQNGNVDRYIQDVTGQFIKDEYHTPCRLPKGVEWPFGELTEPKIELPTTFLKDSYKVFKTIKNDAKGRVMKSIRLKGFMFQWIVIKEAKHGVFSDANGRDNLDRLHWQTILQQDLKGKIPVPEVYDFFEEKGNTYLVMQYIQGKSLNQAVSDIYKWSPWFEFKFSKKKRLLDLLIKVVNVVDKLHGYGYVHRDLNGSNFILTNKDQLVAIDLELAFSLTENKPDPPYTLGTPGFMSPEQMELDHPDINQDIYSLGALMIMYFTNLTPGRFEHYQDRLTDDLYFFIRNEEVTQLIASCLSRDPAKRPDITTIRSGLTRFRENLAHPHSPVSDSHVSVEFMTNSVINAMALPTMLGSIGIWQSSAFEENGKLANEQGTTIYSPGFYSGVSGVMYVLAKARLAGYSVSVIREIFDNSLQFLQTDFLSNLSNLLPSLYHGSSGIALTLAKGIEAGLIDEGYKATIENALNSPVHALNVAHGVAGQGLAVLNCVKVLSEESKNQLLGRYIEVLLENQQKDGSWLTLVQGSKQSIRYTGFSYGVAGITYFLLRYIDHYQDEHVLSATLKALQWLKNRSKKRKNGTYWFMSDRDRKHDRSMSNGTAGIATTFIKAYHTLGDLGYKKISEDALYYNPKNTLHPNFTWANGLAGLSEVYLSAAEILENDEWRERANFIKDLFFHTSLGDEYSRYWMLENTKSPTADLMMGNSGILHFLLRYNSCEHEPFFL